MQIHDDSETTEWVERLIADAVPDGRGLAAWERFLRAHATVMRLLATSLVEETGLTLGDFDALGQIAYAGGELRMTDLAARAFSSRANMTRRIDRLVEEGLVRRAKSDADGRGMVVTLTDAGKTRLAETVPVHLRGVSKLFAAPLDDNELAVLKRALGKIIHDCTFG